MSASVLFVIQIAFVYGIYGAYSSGKQETQKSSFCQALIHPPNKLFAACISERPKG